MQQDQYKLLQESKTLKDFCKRFDTSFAHEIESALLEYKLELHEDTTYEIDRETR